MRGFDTALGVMAYENAVGGIYYRRSDLARVVLVDKTDNQRDQICALYSTYHRPQLLDVSYGCGVPRGYYVPDYNVPHFRNFVLTPIIQEHAGIGILKGAIKRLKKIVQELTDRVLALEADNAEKNRIIDELRAEVQMLRSAGSKVRPRVRVRAMSRVA